MANQPSLSATGRARFDPYKLTLLRPLVVAHHPTVISPKPYHNHAEHANDRLELSSPTPASIFTRREIGLKSTKLLTKASRRAKAGGDAEGKIQRITEKKQRR